MKHFFTSLRKELTVALIIFFAGILIVMALPARALPKFRPIILSTIFTYETAPIPDLQFGFGAGLLSIAPYKQNDEGGTMLIRLDDGMEQFMPGSWTFELTQFENAIIYGVQPNKNQNDPKNQEIYFIHKGIKIIPITPDEKPGLVASVKENIRATYLFITFKNATKPGESFCVYEIVGSHDTSCLALPLDHIARGAWIPHPKRYHTLILQTENGSFFRYDPWGEKIEPILETDNEYQEAGALIEKEYFEEKKSQKRDYSFTMFRIPFFFITLEGGRIGIYRRPLFSTVSPIEDDQHFLIKTNTSLSVVELTTKKTADLAIRPDMNKKKIQFLYKKTMRSL